MVLGQLLLPAMALGLLVAGHPAVNNVARRDVEEERVGSYDSTTEAEPMQVSELVYFTEAGAPEDARLSSVDRAWKVTLPKGAQLSSPGSFTPSADVHGFPGSHQQGQHHHVHKSSAPAVQASAGRSRPAQSDADNASPVPPFNGSGAASHDSPSESFGVSYAPYHANHQCKSKKDISQDFERFVNSSRRRFGKPYSVVRIYGTDCDQVAPVRDAAKAHGIKVFLGIWEPAAAEDEARKISQAFGGDWDMVDTVSVGNELVNNNKASPADMVRAVDQARSTLREAGYQGPVVIVDTFKAYIAHPELGQASDYCAFNAHAFFDSTISAPQAGRWLQDTVQQVKSVCGSSKRVVVTETGWPTSGSPNGRAVPGPKNQKLAIDSITHEFSSNPGDVVLFSAFNDLWKKRDAATFNAEQSWGITK